MHVPVCSPFWVCKCYYTSKLILRTFSSRWVCNQLLRTTLPSHRSKSRTVSNCKTCSVWTHISPCLFAYCIWPQWLVRNCFVLCLSETNWLQKCLVVCWMLLQLVSPVLHSHNAALMNLRTQMTTTMMTTQLQVKLTEDIWPVNHRYP